MAAGSGRNFNLYYGDAASPEVFALVGSLRGLSYPRSGEAVPTTTKDSDGERELLSGGGDKAFTVSGTGVLKNTAAETAMAANYEDQLLHNYQVRYPDGAIHEFAGQITAWEASAEHNGAVEFSVTIEGSGSKTITP